MNTRETVATMCVAGIAMAVLSIAFVLPFQAREGVSAQYGGGAITGGSMTGGSTNATMGTNATTSGGAATAGGGGNQSAVSEATMHINEAMSAAQSGDMQGVMMHLRLALNVLGNMTSTTAAGGNMTGTTGGTTMTQSNQNNVI